MNNIQQFDQLQAMLRDLSPVLWSYYSRLIEQGFEKEEALRLTMKVQDKLFG